MYQWGWAASFLTAEQLPLAVAIFLAFPTVPVAAALARRRNASDSTGLALGHMATLGALVPLLFVLHVATVTEYGRHFWLLFGMLLAVDVGLFAVAWGLGRWVLHAAGALGTVLAFGLWMGDAYSHAAWPAILPIHVVFSLFYLLAVPVARSRGANISTKLLSRRITLILKPIRIVPLTMEANTTTAILLRPSRSTIRVSPEIC